MKTSSRIPRAAGSSERRGWALVLGLAALPLVACKLHEKKSDEPERSIRSWTLAEIEAELERNDQVLASEGIMVAMASPVVTPSGSTPTTGPGPELELEPGIEPEVADDGDAVQTTEPKRTASEPEPTSAPSEAYSADATAVRRSSSRQKSARAASRDAPSRCDRVCELAVVTCELETQICELAGRHPDEPRYATACERAEQQCLAASKACQSCED